MHMPKSAKQHSAKIGSYGHCIWKGDEENLLAEESIGQCGEIARKVLFEADQNVAQEVAKKEDDFCIEKEQY